MRACRRTDLRSAQSGGAPSDDTQVFLISASNCWAQQLTWWQKIQKAKARGCKIITIDSRRTKAAEIADIHLQPKIGTDTAVGAAMIHVIIREDLYNHEFVEKWTHGFKELADYVKDWTPQRAEEISGVPAADIEAAARLWCKGPGSFWQTPQSLSHSSNGIHNARIYLLLPALLGYLDIPGGVPFPKGPKGLGNHSSAIHPDMKEAKWWNDHERRLQRYDAKVVPLWNDMRDAVSPNRLPEWVKEGKLQGLAGFGFNVNIWPSPAEFKAAIAKLDFAFAVDYFYRPDSHEDLDIVLPSAMNYERFAPFGVYGARIGVRHPVKPLGEAKEDWRIALELGCIIDKPERFFDGDPEKALAWLLEHWKGDYKAAVKALPEITVLESPAPVFRKYESGKFRPDGKPASIRRPARWNSSRPAPRNSASRGFPSTSR